MRSEDTEMSDVETLEACCKLMAKIFSKQALNLNATNINYKVENITDCLLKQIVKQAGYCLCPEILELLDIAEVE